MYDAMHTDKDAPQIEVDNAQLLEISVQDSMSSLLQGVSARDQQSGDLTDKVVVEGLQLINDSGLIEVSYAVADQSGNVAKVTREVKYTDYIGPKFTMTCPLILRSMRPLTS